MLFGLPFPYHSRSLSFSPNVLLFTSLHFSKSYDCKLFLYLCLYPRSPAQSSFHPFLTLWMLRQTVGLYFWCCHTVSHHYHLAFYTHERTNIGHSLVKKLITTEQSVKQRTQISYGCFVGTDKTTTMMAVTATAASSTVSATYILLATVEPMRNKLMKMMT